MAKLNILDELNDPFGSKYFKKLDDIQMSRLDLLNPKRIDLLANGNDRIESVFYINRIIDNLNVNFYIMPTNKNDLVEAEILSGDR